MKDIGFTTLYSHERFDFKKNFHFHFYFVAIQVEKFGGSENVLIKSTQLTSS